MGNTNEGKKWPQRSEKKIKVQIQEERKIVSQQDSTAKV
jgi:hypothetical protein